MPSHRRASCFNGVALKRERRAIDHHPERLLPLDASTESLSSESEEVKEDERLRNSAFRFNGVALKRERRVGTRKGKRMPIDELQRSRSQARAKRCQRMPRVVELRAASTESLSSESEEMPTGIYRYEGNVALQRSRSQARAKRSPSSSRRRSRTTASTESLSSESEEPSYEYATAPAPLTRFNGVALKRERRDTDRTLQLQGYIVLQRSRSQARAKSRGTRGSREDRGRGFNGVALKRERRASVARTSLPRKASLQRSRSQARAKRPATGSNVVIPLPLQRSRSQARAKSKVMWRSWKNARRLQRSRSQARAKSI